jgi:hypothetical protein
VRAPPGVAVLAGARAHVTQRTGGSARPARAARPHSTRAQRKDILKEKASICGAGITLIWLSGCFRLRPIYGAGITANETSSGEKH